MHFDFSVKFLMSLMLAPVSVYGSLPDSVSSHTNIPEVVVTGEKHAPVPTTNTSQTINLKKSDRLVLQNVSDAVRRMAGAEMVVSADLKRFRSEVSDPNILWFVTTECQSQIARMVRWIWAGFLLTNWMRFSCI